MTRPELPACYPGTRVPVLPLHWRDNGWTRASWLDLARYARRSAHTYRRRGVMFAWSSGFHSWLLYARHCVRMARQASS